MPDPELPDPEMPGPAPPRLPQRALALIPHPDDEAYAMAGLMRRLSGAGVEVHVVAATRGEGGYDHSAPSSAPQAIGHLRSEELARSCGALGLPPPTFLDWPDGGLRDLPSAHPIADLLDLLRQLQPDLICSLGADGAYGHADHVALFEYLRLALVTFDQQDAGVSRRWLAAVFPSALFLPQWHHMTAGRDAAQVSSQPPPLGSDQTDLVLSLAFDEQQAKLRSIAAHRSQLPDGRPRSLFPGDIIDALLPREAYRLLLGPALAPDDPLRRL